MNKPPTYAQYSYLPVWIDPKAAVPQLYRLSLASDYAPEFMVWYYLDDALADIEAGHYPHAYESLTKDNFEEVVYTEAKSFFDAVSHDTVA